MNHLPAPGIYFGMDEDEYRAAPALSSSGIRDLLISPLDYWTNSPLNPGYVDEKTDAMVLGTAFHRRLLEPDRFSAMYATWPKAEDYPAALDGQEELKARCHELGLKKSGKIADLCERILEADPDAQLWPVIKSEIIKRNAGRTFLKASDLADIERAAWVISAHSSAAKALTGGQAEVSIFWVDDETDVPLKIRVDYLKVKALLDVKSFSNPLGKPIASALASAVANGRYDVQAVIYSVGVEIAKAMLREKGASILRGADAIDNDWLLAFAACQRHTFAFLFVQTGAVTNVRLREFREIEQYGGQGMTQNAYWSSGMMGFRKGVHRYVDCMKRFGRDKPWIDDEPMRPFADTDFPMYLFNEAA